MNAKQLTFASIFVGFAQLSMLAAANAADLNGIHPEPALIAGVAEWQIESHAPRDHVSALRWNAKTNRVACIESTGVVRIYDPATWQLTGILNNSQQFNAALAWSPDGTQLATSHSANTIRIWNIDGSVETTIAGHTDEVRAIAWGPLGKRLVSTGRDHQVIGWRSDGTKLFAGTKHTAEVTTIDWSVGGQLIATGSADKTVRIWHVPREGDVDGKPSIELKCDDAAIQVVRWSPDGDYLATADHLGNVRVWKPDGTLAWKFLQKKRVADLVWSSDSQRLATTNGNSVSIWTRQGKSIDQLSGPFHLTHRLAWSPDVKTIVAVIDQGAVWHWDVATSAGSEVLRGHVSNNIMHRPVQWTLDSQKLTVASRDHAIRFWSRDGKPGASWRVPGRFMWDAAISPDSKVVATFSFGEKGVRLWNLDGSDEKLITEHCCWTSWSPDGSKLAIPHQNGKLVVLNRDGKELSESKARRASWSPDGRWLAATDPTTRKDIRLLKADGTEGPLLRGHESEIDAAIDWHPMGHQLVSIEREGIPRIWNLDGTTECVLAKHDTQGGAVAWSPDGVWIASSSSDLHFSRTDGSLASAVVQLGAIVRNLRWNADSSWLAAQVHRQSVRLFKADGTVGPTLAGNNLSPESATWSPDGKLIACPTIDRTLIVWEAKTGQMQWLGLQFRSGRPGAVSATGELIGTDAGAFDEQFVFIERQKDGIIKIHSADEFAKLAR